ncbi:hypothetical protein TIFTF001_026381 [Ficus carica]|uniref:Uncharacterized protein n=1 Tax=Ficus carica TaxID=3494 RepID=A0AA88DL36_FICCA|nr:hypothetical protein TIFTF001_026381 [Ficus carica]
MKYPHFDMAGKGRLLAQDNSFTRMRVSCFSVAPMASPDAIGTALLLTLGTRRAREQQLVQEYERR